MIVAASTAGDGLYEGLDWLASTLGTKNGFALKGPFTPAQVNATDEVIEKRRCTCRLPSFFFPTQGGESVSSLLL